jgi:hypothetical protein
MELQDTPVAQQRRNKHKMTRFHRYPLLRSDSSDVIRNIRISESSVFYGVRPHATQLGPSWVSKVGLD